jgi:hypothetical protein
MGEAGPRRRIRDADEMLTGRALNLPPGVARVAFQRLIAVGTIKLKFVRAHRFPFHDAESGRKNKQKIYSYF